jgi:hypothetical protein
MSDSERHGQAWNADEERRLYDAFVAGVPIKECVEQHQRSSGGIRAALKRLGLIDENGGTVSPTPAFTPSSAALKRQQKAASKPALTVRKTPEELTEPELNEGFRNAIRLMEDTDKHLFITGKAGTGKSTLLAYFCRTTRKNPVVLAPTGVAALNVKGQTIHSFFNFYVDVTPEKIRQKKTRPRNAKLYKKLKTIIIDEISMVRADLLDSIDEFLQLYGPHPSRRFGGVQMIFVGDLYQLPPVVSSQEREIFATRYATPYFFSSHVLADTQLARIDLDKVYRQKDPTFVDLLNKIRNNSVNDADLALVNNRVAKSGIPLEQDFQITLTTTNVIADAINDTHLAALRGKSYSATAEVEGDFGREYFPTAADLQYKAGAQIMMLNNDPEKRWVNGSIGMIEAMKQDIDGKNYLTVRLQDAKKTVEVYPYTWEVYRFSVDNGAITSEPAGAFTQYPFRLAWAITIHKSQGKTFKRIAIDIGRGAFAAGQMYVALSRCTSLAGITLKTPVRARDISTDPRIVDFLASYEADDSATTPLSTAEKIQLIEDAIAAKAALSMIYLKADDTRTEHKIIPRVVGAASYQGQAYEGMKAFCLSMQKDQMYRVDRILKLKKIV